jgi:hypothetical protein
MLKNKIEVEESHAAPPLTPDLLGKLKMQDMQAAVVERFSVRTKAQAPRTGVCSRER